MLMTDEWLFCLFFWYKYTPRCYQSNLCHCSFMHVTIFISLFTRAQVLVKARLHVWATVLSWRKKNSSLSLCVRISHSMFFQNFHRWVNSIMLDCAWQNNYINMHIWSKQGKNQPKQRSLGTSNFTKVSTEQKKNQTSSDQFIHAVKIKIFTLHHFSTPDFQHVHTHTHTHNPYVWPFDQ